MQVTRNSIETAAGPGDWFTGTVYIDTIAPPSEGSRVSASSVHFTPGARTAWHTHPNGQTIWVTEGIGLCRRRGGPIEVIKPGDRVDVDRAGEPVARPGHGLDVAPGDLHACAPVQRGTSLSVAARACGLTMLPTMLSA